MCILLTLLYAKFDVSRIFCSKVIEEKYLGGLLDPLMVKEGLRFQEEWGEGGGGGAGNHLYPRWLICQPNWLDHWRVKAFFKHFSLCGF